VATKEEILQKGVLEGRSPSYVTTSPSPLKERGIKGVRLINNLKEVKND
jgi:hypothetical protein